VDLNKIPLPFYPSPFTGEGRVGVVKGGI